VVVLSAGREMRENGLRPTLCAVSALCAITARRLRGSTALGGSPGAGLFRRRSAPLGEQGASDDEDRACQGRQARHFSKKKETEQYTPDQSDIADRG
jgi:hypothetical protein